MIDENNRDGRRFEKNEKQVENGCGGSRTKASQDEYSRKLATSNKAIHSDAMVILQMKDDRMDCTNRQDELPLIVGVDI